MGDTSESHSADNRRMCVLKELSVINGRINQMTEEEVSKKLKKYGLNLDGNIEVKKKRLKTYCKRVKLSKIDHCLSSRSLPYYVVVDFEATCLDPNPPKFKHEIIEFPAVLVDSQKQEIISTFHSYCRPTINTVLSPFCRSLTGISQADVDQAEPFINVLRNFENWLEENNLKTDYFALVADGPWDVCRFLFTQCLISGIPLPKWACKYINIRKVFGNFYKVNKTSLTGMLDKLGLKFQGRPHCGLDDARNVAAILIQLLCDGAPLLPNELAKLPPFMKGKFSFNEINDQLLILMGNLSICQTSWRPINEDSTTFQSVLKERQRKMFEVAKSLPSDLSSQESGLEDKTIIGESTVLNVKKKKKKKRKPKLCH